MNERLNRLLDAFIALIESGEHIPDEVYSEVTNILRSNINKTKGAENLWVLSGGNPKAFQNYMKSFPDAALNVLGSNPSELRNLENTFSRRITFPSGEVAQGIPKADLNSSNVYGFSYDPRNSVLNVRFQGGGVYRYENVPPQVFKTFKSGAIPARTNGRNAFGQWWIGKNPSLGATFFNTIRDKFPYQRVA